MAQKRMRVIAGPNGSGKSTIMRELDPVWIGVFVNADDLERSLRAGAVDLGQLYGLAEDDGDFLARLCVALRSHGLAARAPLQEAANSIAARSRDATLSVDPEHVNSYLAAALVDIIRRELLRAGETFTFETVMSSRDKVDFMREAREAGYRTYLYFVATDADAEELTVAAQALPLWFVESPTYRQFASDV